MMAEPDPGRGSTLRVVATATDEGQAELLEQRLAEAGIRAISKRALGGPEFGASGARYVYVEATDLARARKVLEPPDESEFGG
jgi:Putative prokaryotic signal transducing protein